jgi:hypothetical protein
MSFNVLKNSSFGSLTGWFPGWMPLLLPIPIGIRGRALRAGSFMEKRPVIDLTVCAPGMRFLLWQTETATYFHPLYLP